MSHPVRMIVSLTPQNVLTVDDINFLRGLDLTEDWLFEYVLAMYGVMEDLRTLPNGEDHMFEQFAGDLGDMLFQNEVDPSSVDAQARVNQNFTHLFHLMRKIVDQLRPFVDPISHGLPDRPVEVITYEPFVVPPKGRVISPAIQPQYRASLLTFHLEDPNPSWLRSHEMWRNANDETPEADSSR